MSAAENHHAVLSRLREEIRRIERRPARREGFLSSGLAEVDAVLPGGGFPRGALAELAGGPASGKTGVALSVIASLGGRDLAAYVDGRGELYPPAAAALGVDLSRLLIVRPDARAAPGRDPALGALWAMEALLASGAFAAVAVDAGWPGALRGADGVARRLHAAAERGGAAGLWLSHGDGARPPAALRVEIEARGGRVVAHRTVAGTAVPERARGGGHAA